MIRLALTDLDNTLIAFGQSCASRRARAAIHDLLDTGIRFGPVTGRVPAAMRWMFAGDQACYATGAFVNGQLLFVDGRLVEEHTIEGVLLDEVADYLADWDGAALGVYDLDRVEGVSDGAVSYVGVTAVELERHGTAFPRPYDLLDHVNKSSYLKTNIRCDLSRQDMKALVDELRTRFSELSFVVPMAGGPFIDLLPAHCDKGRAVERLIAALGVTPDEVCAFGDSENDLAMLRRVTHAVAVENASDEVRQAALHHIGACADDAVACALEEIARATTTGTTPAFMRKDLRLGTVS